jgi:hypothetical protein
LSLLAAADGATGVLDVPGMGAVRRDRDDPHEGNLHARLATALRERYVLERELGRGGMATVYLTRRPRAR